MIFLELLVGLAILLLLIVVGIALPMKHLLIGLGATFITSVSAAAALLIYIS